MGHLGILKRPKKYKFVQKDDILSQSWVSRLSPKLEHLFGALDL